MPNDRFPRYLLAMGIAGFLSGPAIAYAGVWGLLATWIAFATVKTLMIIRLRRADEII